MLTQSEADALINIPKIKKSDDIYEFPLPGEKLTIPIISLENQENFLIDVSRGRIRLTKCTYQERCQTIIILVRLDVDGPPHTNPEVVNVPLSYFIPYNGKAINCPHLHLYVEDFGDKWAIPTPQDKFSDTTDLYKTLQDFFQYCNVIETPKIYRRLTLNEF